MRTKMKVLSALVGLASLGATVAQAQVYSLNVVGYVNTSCPPGFSLIANPLNAGTNKLSALIPNPPDLTQVFQFAGGTYTTANYYEGDGWDNDLTITPGMGVWIYNTAPTNLILTFTGEVVQGSTTNQYNAGFSLKSSIVPQSGALDTVLGFVPKDLDQIYLYRNGSYTTCNYYEGDGWDNVPTINVGEGFWISTSTAGEWKRTFNVQ